MRRILAFLCVIPLAALLPAQTVPGATADATKDTTPTITATLDGPPTAVFITPQQSCETNDIPDAMARAFRDSTGTIHFITASTNLYQSLGPSLENLTHSCAPMFLSANDPNPADFNDQVWIDSFYTLDGKNIAGLSHTEYHGWAIPHECHVQGINQYVDCEYDSDTYHFSTNGGYHFETPDIPGNFLAGVPYRYEIDHGPMGYSVDTNVIAFNGWYYAVATAWTWPPNCRGTASLPDQWRRAAAHAECVRSDIVAQLEWQGFFRFVR
jgi:hypothetical protein